MCNTSISGACIAVGFGTFLLSVTVTEDVKANLILFNKNAKSRKKRSQAFKQLAEHIQYHSDAKQLSEYKKGVQCG